MEKAGWREGGWHEGFTGKVKGMLVRFSKGRILQVEATGSTTALR